MRSRRTELGEIVVGLVYPVGIDGDKFSRKIEREVRRFGYVSNPIRLSSLIPPLPGGWPDRPELKRILSRIKGGNLLRERSGSLAVVSMLAIEKIMRARGSEPTLLSGRAHVLRSLKRPEEVQLLRQVYGPGFYLIAVGSSENYRLANLKKRMSLGDARKLMETDKREEGVKYGQRTEETFELADFFVDVDDAHCDRRLARFFDLIFGNPFLTPTSDEHFMFAAYSAALRSGDLSRQVGATLVTASGEVAGLGCNDVPAPGGGLYWPDEPGGSKLDQRDYVQGFDANEVEKRRIESDILDRLFDSANARQFEQATRAALSAAGISPREAEKVWNVMVDKPKRQGLEILGAVLKDSLIHDITEYGRAVHAEMEALLSAARSGVSLKGGTLFTTTFPCHNCAKHIIASGIRRVVFIEPYRKSKALTLHADAAYLAKAARKGTKVHFEPFDGVGPRKFFDLFSMKLSSGYHLRRKESGTGKRSKWKPAVRVPMPTQTYLEREVLAAAELSSILK